MITSSTRSRSCLLIHGYISLVAMSRDLSDQLESVNKALSADKVYSNQRPTVSKESSEMVSRTPVAMLPYQQPMPMPRPPASMRDLAGYIPYPGYEPSPNRPDYYHPQIYPPPIPPQIITPPGPGSIRPQDDPRLRGTQIYKQKDPLGYN